MRRFLSVVIFSFLTCSAYSAGYTCDSIKQYTSCSSGYYMTYNGSYNGTARAGNKCTACGSGCTCAGGTANQVCCTNTCTSTNNTSSTQSCTYTKSISYGTQNWSGSQTCNGKYTGGNNCTGSCTGCSSWGTCGGGTLSSVHCNAGYYKNTSNTCTACPTGSYCPGGDFTPSSSNAGLNSCSNAPANANYSGSATSNACPWSCKAGYYGSSANGNTSCADCGSGNYCEGGTHRATCQSTVKAGAPTPGGITSLSSGNWSDSTHGASANDCICYWYFSDETRIQYMNESGCSVGPSGYNYTNYRHCRTGYYAADPLNWGDWYTSCKACTNKPANSTYTSYSTPSTMYAVEDNCPWQCNANYYKNGSACTACPSGFTSSAGSTAQSACTVTCAAGKYLPGNSGTCTTCPAGKYCAGGTFSPSVSDQGITGSCNAGTYSSGGASAATCTACGADYPYADAGSASVNSCYKNSTKYGGRNNAALPTGCAVQTQNECTLNSCIYRTYSNGTTSSCTVSNCNNTHKACTSASTNYYLASGVAKTCSSYNASYPSSDGGNITSSSCYGTFSKSGNQVEPAAPAVPSGCATRTYSTSACTPETCNYTKYASGTIKTDCAPANCTKTATITGVTAGTNHYVSGITCPACPTAYPSSDGGSISDANCYVLKTNTGTINRANASCVTDSCTYNTCSCTPGTCTWRDYYSATDTTCTPDNCSCTNSVKSWTGNPGYYFNGSSMAKCGAGNYCAGFTVTSAPTNGVGQTVCGTNTYSDAGAITCTACDTAHGYGNSGSAAANHNSVASCRVTCAGGQYVASASAGCVNVGAGYWGAGGTVAQNATLARTACASGLTTIGYGRGADEAADCGRILHAGDRQIYLRSDKKTTPSLNVKIDDAVYYGNMTAGALDGYLIIKDGDVTYRVHDDSD